MSDKINSRICLMVSVYKTFHQTVKYGHQRNHILRFNWAWILNSYEGQPDRKPVSNRFSTVKNRFPKTSINTPILDVPKLVDAI